ncbi:MAG: hypothetical protein ACRCTQ_07045 [Brevinemataceae bacterium]
MSIKIIFISGGIFDEEYQQLITYTLFTTNAQEVAFLTKNVKSKINVQKQWLYPFVR